MLFTISDNGSPARPHLPMSGYVLGLKRIQRGLEDIPLETGTANVRRVRALAERPKPA